MTLKPGKYDVTVYQGATLSEVFTWRDSSNALVNLTGYTARLMARTNRTAATPFITLTTENGGIALGGSAGTITLSMSAASTAALDTFSGIYDLEMIAGSGAVSRLLCGALTVSPEVTT